jgi:hypothetical protein
MFSPQRLVQIVSAPEFCTDMTFRVVWVTISEGSRDAYAAEVRAASQSHAVIPLVLRTSLFTDANLLLADFNRLIESNRASFEVLDRVECESCITVVLLAKDELRLPQTSSPVCLPQWFPWRGGQEVFFRIADVAADASVLLNADEARVDEMASALLELEHVMIRRVARASDSAVSKFMAETGSKAAVTLAQEAAALFASNLGTVTDARAYRPTVRKDSSLTARLIRLVLKSSPDLLPNAAALVADMLAIQHEQVRPPMIAVLLRPTRSLNTATSSAHALLLTVYGAYQFTTGAAHAGDYPAVPAGLVYHTSLDLRRSLRSAIQSLAIGADEE